MMQDAKRSIKGEFALGAVCETYTAFCLPLCHPPHPDYLILLESDTWLMGRVRCCCCSGWPTVILRATFKCHHMYIQRSVYAFLSSSSIASRLYSICSTHMHILSVRRHKSCVSLSKATQTHLIVFLILSFCVCSKTIFN